MGGTIPYTVNPAVCWNTTWPSGSFKQSECFTSSESFNTCRLTPHSPFLSPTTPVSMTADIGPDRSVSEASVTEARWRHYSFFFFFFYKEVLDSVLSVVFLSSQRTQPPATISTTTTQILSPDTTPLMRTSEFSAFSHYLTFPFSYDHYAARA